MVELFGSPRSRYLALPAAGDDPRACLQRGRRPSATARCEPNNSTWVLAVVATPVRSGVAMSVSTGRPRPGPGAPLTAERESYLRLVAQGMSNVQAGREVGVHPTTGMRWRDGPKMVDGGDRARYYPPINAHPVAISPRYLSEDERVLIGDLVARRAVGPFRRHRVGAQPVHGQPGDPPQRQRRRQLPTVHRAPVSYTHL